MDRKTALKIMDRITPLGVNVVMVAIADPSYGTLNPDRVEGEPDYQIELSRNNALDGAKIAEVIDAIDKLNAWIEFPNMTVMTVREKEARDDPGVEPVPTPETPTEPTDPGTPTPDVTIDPTEPQEPVQASPTTDDAVQAGIEDPRES